MMLLPDMNMDLFEQSRTICSGLINCGLLTFVHHDMFPSRKGHTRVHPGFLLLVKYIFSFLAGKLFDNFTHSTHQICLSLIFVFLDSDLIQLYLFNSSYQHIVCWSNLISLIIDCRFAASWQMLQCYWPNTPANCCQMSGYSLYIGHVALWSLLQ